MATLQSSIGGLEVESVVFPQFIKPPGSTNTLFLAGAGVRGLEIQGKFIKFTALGVYLEDKAIPLLTVKWKGKTAAELTDSVDFYRDIVTGSFEKFVIGTMIIPLTGKQFSEKLSESLVQILKNQGTYTDADAIAIDKFLEVFKDQNFPPASSFLFTISPTLTISLSKDGVIPKATNSILENEKLGPAILESVIGMGGISPAARQSLTSRLSDLMNQFDEKANENFQANCS